jgi:hypothetical protein
MDNFEPALSEDLGDLQGFIRAIVHQDIACRSPSISHHKNTPAYLKLRMVIAVVSTKL